jgi:3-methyladenine DNA glycosylase AlkD
MPSLKKLTIELEKFANSQTKKTTESFFKTGIGEYAEGDIFIGIKMPILRKVAKNYRNLDIEKLEKLLQSKIHEQRMLALIILEDKFRKTGDKEKKEIFNFYLANTKYINNWDLVDISAPKIVGCYLENKDKKILYKLAASKNLWERRIAIVSTHYFIKNNIFFDTLTISELLLKDQHDLIQKAVGWMLREVGKRDKIILKKFLDKFKNIMPRTTLRYAIEKFPDNIRKQYLKK